MNLDIVIKPLKDGRFTLSCPNFPDCESEGASVEEAMDLMIDKITNIVAGNIKQNLRETFKDMKQKLSASGPIDVPLMMSKLPLSLN